MYLQPSLLDVHFLRAKGKGKQLGEGEKNMADSEARMRG